MRKLLNLEDAVDYRAPYQISHLTDLFAPGEFDVVVCAGIIYHMLYPMQAFTETRKIIRDGGFLLMETPYDPSSDKPTLTFNGASPLVDEPYTYFVPTISALKGMAHLTGYRVIAERKLKTPKRVTLLLQAVSRETLIEDPSVADMTRQMLKRDLSDFAFRFRDIEALPVTESIVPTPEIAPFRQIDVNREKVDFPYHPSADVEPVGQTRFETPKGNRLKL